MKLKHLNIHSKAFAHRLVYFFLLLLVGYCNSSIADQDISNKMDAAQDLNLLSQDINSALRNQVDVLSPDNFKEAKKSFEDAKESLAKQKEIKKKIVGQITIARDYLNSANEAVKLSNKHIEEVVLARRQAVAAGADHLFASEFQKADDLLLNITADLEYDIIPNLEKNRTALQTSYSDLELRAINHQNLTPSRLTIIQAIKDGAKKYAPEDLALALKNYKETSAYIAAHRHDEDQIHERSIAVKQRADQLLQITRRLAEAKNIPSVELALQAEDNGTLADVVRSQQSSVVFEQKSFNEKLEQARRQFTENEAEVSRRGNILIIRLRGFEFPSAQAVLKDSNLPLLGKVQRVIKDIGYSSIVVEGHTDSIGSEAMNEKLSHERAKTVKDYFLSIDATRASRIKSVGYGEQNPMATNKTAEGRAQNRRVDILIKL